MEGGKGGARPQAELGFGFLRVGWGARPTADPGRLPRVAKFVNNVLPIQQLQM